MSTLMSILKDLGIEPGALFVNIVGFVLLLWLMKRVLFGPVTHFMDQRKAKIKDMVDEAERDRLKASQERAEVESTKADLLKAVHEQAEAAREAAQREAEELKKAARERAHDVERTGHAQIERERDEVALQLRDELAQSASAMCARILATTLTEERHKALLDQFIADIKNMADSERAPQ